MRSFGRNRPTRIDEASRTVYGVGLLIVVLNVIGVSIAVAKDNTRLRATLDYELETLSRDGVYADLYLKYFPTGFYCVTNNLLKIPPQIGRGLLGGPVEIERANEPAGFIHEIGNGDMVQRIGPVLAGHFLGIDPERGLDRDERKRVQF